MRPAFILGSPVRRLQLDLSGIGLPEVPCFGVHHEISAAPGLSPHRHPRALEICQLISGERTYHVGGRDYSFRGGEVFVTYPDEWHGSGRHPHGKGLLYWCQIVLPRRPASFLTLTAGEAWPLVRRLRHLPRRHFQGNPQLKTLYEDCLSLLTGPATDLTRIAVSSRLVQWLGVLLDCSTREPAKRITGDIQRVIDLIDRHHDDSIGVNAMASTAGLSVSRFKAKFKTQMGLPPAEHLLRRRIATAERLLARGRPVTDVAYELGFCSSQYFATVFKRLTHRRPTDPVPGGAPADAFRRPKAASPPHSLDPLEPACRANRLSRKLSRPRGTTT